MYAFMCTSLHCLYLLPCPAVDPHSVFSALFDNEAAATVAGLNVSVMMLSLMPQLAVYIRLINLLVSRQSAFLKSKI